MAFRGGDENINREGRPKGSPNKVTKDLRDAYKEFVENNVPHFQKWISEVAADNPAKALELVASLSEYFMPKLQRTELDVKADEGFKLEVGTKEDKDKADETANLD
jgi:hypothetical protein